MTFFLIHGMVLLLTPQVLICNDNGSFHLQHYCINSHHVIPLFLHTTLSSEDVIHGYILKFQAQLTSPSVMTFFLIHGRCYIIIPGTSYTIVADDGVIHFFFQRRRFSNAFTVDDSISNANLITLTPDDSYILWIDGSKCKCFGSASEH